ncbi:MAG: glycosyltransferase family 4 protein [Candidatus Tectomicrobia bacterium]|nr:glycosyltransferase family 4 protein [Candidatus Tectomicrobia bacterium]
MRLGIDAREFAGGTTTGIQRYLRNFLAVNVRERPDITFLLYGNQKTVPHLRAPNVQWRCLPERLALWWDQVTLARRLRRDRVEVFLSPYLKGPLCSPCPLVITIHDLMFFILPEYRREQPLWRRWLLRRYGALAVRAARRIITDSEHSRRDILRFFPAAEGKVETVPLGLAAHFRPPRQREQARATARRYGLDGPYLLYVGNFRPHKNVEGLLRAYARLSDEQRRAHRLVLVAGRRSGRAAVETQVRQLRVGDQVTFAEAVPDEDLAGLYGMAHLFVFPSRYEGFGLPVLEAMACGAPVICSNRTSLPEVAGDCALYVDPDDPQALHAAMQRLLNDTAERERLAALGLKRSQAFNQEVIARRILAVLEGCRAPCAPSPAGET